MDKRFQQITYTLFCVATGMVGYHIHHSFFWALVDWLFAPLAWCYWLITQQVNATIIQETFGFLLK